MPSNSDGNIDLASTDGAASAPRRGLPLIVLLVAAGLSLIAAPIVAISSAAKAEGDALAHAIAFRAGSPFYYGCRSAGRARFECEVTDGEGSATVSYSVRRTSRRCWEARRTSGEGETPMPARMSGCVGFFDRYELPPGPLGPSGV